MSRNVSHFDVIAQVGGNVGMLAAARARDASVDMSPLEAGLPMLANALLPEFNLAQADLIVRMIYALVSGHARFVAACAESNQPSNTNTKAATRGKEH